MVDDLVKLLLGFTISVSVLGISIQIMRLLGTTNSILQDLRGTLQDIGELIGKIKDDYDSIAAKVLGLTDGITALKDNVVEPISRAAATVGAYVDVFNNKLRGQDRDK